MRAIKQRVDEVPSPGQNLLTGSVNFLSAPSISESLAGRAAFLEVWPLTQGELAGEPERFIDLIFADPACVRDITEQFGLRKADEFRQLLRLFAARTSDELVMTAVVDDAPLERQTVYDHRAWLEAVFLLRTVAANELDGRRSDPVALAGPRWSRGRPRARGR